MSADLTIAEVARAVGKDEGYVRQHIHRGHLKASPGGDDGPRRIALGDAVRWAQSRDLEFGKHHVKNLSMEPDKSGVIVELTVEVIVPGWDSDCSIMEVVERSTREAREKLETIFSGRGDIRVLEAKTARVVCNAKRK